MPMAAPPLFQTQLRQLGSETKVGLPLALMLYACRKAALVVTSSAASSNLYNRANLLRLTWVLC